MDWGKWLYFLSGLFLGIAGVGLGLVLRRSLNSPQRRSRPQKKDRPSSRSTNNSTNNSAHHLDREQQLELAYRMATNMAQLKQGFLGRISHELRSPLNGMIGMHQLILNDLCDSAEEEREFVSNAHDSALKLIKLIDEMVMISKAEQGIDIMEIEAVPLTEVFQGIYDLTHLQAANRNLKLDIVMPDPEIYVQADVRRLRQVLTSLVDSAIADMMEGEIHIHADPIPHDNQIYIHLQDHRSAEYWQEPINLLTTKPSEDLSWNGHPSPGLTLMASQCLLELMQGSLEILDGSTLGDRNSDQPAKTYLVCKLPLGITESEDYEPEQLSEVSQSSIQY